MTREELEREFEIAGVDPGRPVTDEMANEYESYLREKFKREITETGKAVARVTIR